MIKIVLSSANRLSTQRWIIVISRINRRRRRR